MLITHDLGVVAEIADDVLVMYAGRAMEYGSADQLFNRPAHPYTWGLLGSMPRFDRKKSERLLAIKGTPPSLINVPSGCPFHPRCEYAARNEGLSEDVRPELAPVEPGHTVACHLSPTERERSGSTRLRRSCDRARAEACGGGHRAGLELDHRRRVDQALPDPRRDSAPPGRCRSGRGRGELRGQAWRDVLDRR